MLQRRLITKGKEVPDFLNSIKPSVMVKKLLGLKSPSKSIRQPLMLKEYVCIIILHKGVF